MRTLYAFLLIFLPMACIAAGASGLQAGTPTSTSQNSKSARVTRSPEIRIPVAHVHRGFTKP
jgi:hypothetical protein